jgi:hypothetical protein
MRLTDPQGLDLITSGRRGLKKFHQHAHAVGSDFSPNFGPSSANNQRFIVNKTELIEHIAKHADLSKAAAGRALEATMGAVRTTLKKGEQFPWWVLVLLPWASVPHAQAATPVRALRLKSKKPMCQSSVQARA